MTTKGEAVMLSWERAESLSISKAADAGETEEGRLPEGTAAWCGLLPSGRLTPLMNDDLQQTTEKGRPSLDAHGW